jgi:hypothetical protein
MIRREYGDSCIRMGSLQVNQCKKHSRPGIPIPGLYDDVGFGEAIYLIQRQAEMASIDNDADSIRGSKQPGPEDCGFEHGRPMQQAAILLGDRDACNLAGQILQPQSITSGQQQSHTIRQRVWNRKRAMGFMPDDVADQGSHRVVSFKSVNKAKNKGG